MTGSGKPWEEEGYSEISAVSSSFGVIDVEFANGDKVEIPISDLGLDNETAFRMDEDSGALLAMLGDAEREIDWMLVRSSADPEFAEEVRKRDTEEARRVGTRLKVLRENSNLSQKAVAELSAMAPSRLNKLERGDTDMRISTVRAVLRALGASFADISGPDAPEVSLKRLVKYARDSGAPAEVVKQIIANASPSAAGSVLEHAFAWRESSLLSGAPEPVGLELAANFKARDPDRARSSPLVRLARTVSEATVSVYDNDAAKLPDTASAIRQQVIEESDAVSLASLCEWAWRAGIAVVPMSGAGSTFAGAAWEIDGRPVAVLNSSQANVVYWLFDLAHEIGHLALGHPREKGVVEVDKQGQVREDQQEDEANRFARDLLVPESDRLLDEIRQRCADQSMEWQEANFKWKVIDVAKEAGVNPALMLTIAAFELTEIAKPKDRWGSANNEAEPQGPARPTLQASFAKHIETRALPEMDAALVKAVVLE